MTTEPAREKDPIGTPVGRYGFLSYCNRCRSPFCAKSMAYATSKTAVCEDCHKSSGNTIANAFSPERKLSK